MAGENAAIWQVQSGAANGTEATAGASNTLLFNSSPQLVTGNYTFNTEVNMRNSSPENPSVAADNNEIQDMGIDGLDIQITGRIFQVSSDTSTSNVNKLVRFWKEDNTTTGYTKGRFGLRLDDMPQFNVNPTSTYGYHLVNPQIIRDGELEDKAAIVFTLRLGGDITNAI